MFYCFEGEFKTWNRGLLEINIIYNKNEIFESDLYVYVS